MNEHEARLEIVRTLRDVLVDLADDGEVSQEDLDAMDASMLDAAELLLEALELQVVSVGPDGEVTVTVLLGDVDSGQ